jgi:hypothetical protein
MRKIVIQKDKLLGSLFNEKECVLYKKWFAEFMNDDFAQYMRSINDENIQWLSLATVKSIFENWIQQQTRSLSCKEFCEKYSHKNIVIYGGQLIGPPLSAENLVFLLTDYLSTLYILDDAVTNDRDDVHNFISLWNVFVPGRLSQWEYVLIETL